MNNKNNFIILIASFSFVTLVGLSGMMYWLKSPTKTNMYARSVDHYAQELANKSKGGYVDMEGTFTSFTGTPSKVVTGSWPRFRGPNFDNISPEKTKLINSFNKSLRLSYPSSSANLSVQNLICKFGQENSTKYILFK